MKVFVLLERIVLDLNVVWSGVTTALFCVAVSRQAVFYTVLSVFACTLLTVQRLERPSPPI